MNLHRTLITLEGLDFTGKTTIARHLERTLCQANVDVVVTREPGGTTVGEHVRRLLLAPEHVEMLPLSELLLFMVSRAQHTREVILPALAAGKTVLTSRYRLSSLAYQGYGRGLDLDLVRRLNDAVTEGREADITLLIDVPVDVALARKRGAGDRIEAEDSRFYERVREGYLELTRDDPRVHRIDGTKPVDRVCDDIERLLGLPVVG